LMIVLLKKKQVQTNEHVQMFETAHGQA